MDLVTRAIEYYRDPGYFSELRRLAAPLIAQQFIYAVLNMVGVIFLGQKSESAVAAVALAGQVFFLLNLVLFGIISGSAMFTAQYWGQRNVQGVRQVLGLCLVLALGTSFVFFLLAELFPEKILQIYSNDPVVIVLGADYLRIYAWTFILFAITFSYSLVLRSIGDVRTPTTISISTLILNTLLMYGFLFGKFGLPELGVRGAAVAALIFRLLECGILLTVTYIRKSPVAASLGELTRVDLRFAGNFIKPVLPVIANEFLWALGTTAYSAIYGHISTDAIAAMNIVSTLDQMAMVTFFSIGSATSVMVGNLIGSGRTETAQRFAGRSLGIGALGGLLMGALLAVLKYPILSLYHVPPQVVGQAAQVLVVISIFLWMRIMNSMLVVAVLRAGGDTIYSLVLDGLIIWIVGVPLTAMAAFIFHLPLQYVYLCAMSEEVAKWALGFNRYLSQKWIHNLAHPGSMP